jgi:two-component system OmpR family response regulator
MDGEEGHFLGDTEPYDAVILDLGLPVMDGITVLERWRADGKTMPVLILTARDRWREKVAGFDAGADDYVAKPFQMEELLARLRALIRRAAGHASAVIECGPLRVVSRTELTEHIYDQDFDRDSNTIEVFIGRLRRKLGSDLIVTERGLGYRLADSDQPSGEAG